MSDNLEPSLRQELICCGGVDSKWGVARLELDVKVELSDSKSQKLSGQVRETSAQEMLCLTVRPPAQMFDTGLRTLREHITQLYRAPEGSRLPAVVDMDRWAEEASSPLLPRHPALPALFAITAPPEQDSTSCDNERPIRMAFRYHSHSLRSVLSLERYRFTAGCLDVPGFFNHADHLGAATDMRLRFLFYQVLRALSHLHELGCSLGGKCLTSMDLRVTDSHWVCLPPAIHPSLLWPPLTKPQTPPLNLASSLTLSPTPSSSTPLPPTAAPSSSAPVDSENTTSGGLLRMSVAAAVPRSVDSRVPLTEQWASGRLSNLEYLLALNRAAGRSTMDARLPSLFPWVSDLSTPWGGWRDLGKSKLRLTKGDEFLDMTFRQQQQHPNSRGHHVDECLSELCYYMYEARRAPMGCLRRAVRSNFVAAQYPHSVQRLVEWTQDEATVAFYTDPSVLRSKHKSEGLQDLALPSWLAGLCARQRGQTFNFKAEPPAQRVANEEEEEAVDSPPYAAFGGDGAAAFVAYHRSLLESDHVSRRLHEWIDLYFGASLIGNRAFLNKNVPLNPASQTSSSSAAAAAAAASRAPSSGGGGGGNATRGCLVGLGLECRPRLVPLFTHPHPARRCAFTSPPPPLPAAAASAAAVSSAAAVNRTDDGGGVLSGGGVVSALRVKADAGFVAAARQRADYDVWMGGQQVVGRRSSSRSSSNNEVLGGSSGVGWKAATVEKWVMDMVLTPDVLAADAAAAAASASAAASAAAATAQGRGDRQHFAPLLPSSPPPFSLSGGVGGLDLTAKLGADASADELLLRCAPQILLPANTPTLPGHHHHHHDNETGDSLPGALGGLENLDPLTRCCGVDLCEVEGRTSFAQDNDAVVNPYSLQAQGANSVKGLDSTQPRSLSAARRQTEEEGEGGGGGGGGWLSWRDASLLKSGDALAAGLLLGELVAGRPLFSAAQVNQHKTQKTAAHSPGATAHSSGTNAASPSAPTLPTVDLRELLLHSGAGLSREVTPPPVFAAVRGLLHPNPHRRLTVDQVLAANGVGGGGGASRDEEDVASLERGEGGEEEEEESSEGELLGSKKERKKKDALRNKQSNSWRPPSLTAAAAATTQKSRHRHCHNFMRSCDDGCSGSSGGYDDEDKKDCAALAALFPPYFNPLYAFVAKVVACEQEADAIFLDSVPDTNTAATGANTGTAEGESAGDLVDDKGLSEAVGRSEAGLGRSKDERIARCRLEALVVTLEALPELVATLPPLGLAMALPHILNSLLGSSTPYVFAHEDIRRRDNLSQLLRNERSNSRQAPPHSASGGGGETANATPKGAQGSTEAVLLRAALCLATSPVASFARLYGKQQQQQQRSDAGGAATPSPPPPPPSQAVNTTALPPLWWRHSLVLHLPCAVALLGKRLGPEATQTVLLPRLTAFLEAGSWHPSLLLPLLTGLSSSTNNSITTATSTAAASASSAACGKNKKRQLGVGLGAVPCRPHGEVSPSLWGVVVEVGGGWAALLHHLLPLAFNWLAPAHVELQMCLRLRMRRHRTTIAAPSASSPLKTRITGNSEDADRDDQEAGEVVEDCDDDGDGDDGDDSEDSEEEGGGEGCGLRTNGVNSLTTSRRALLRQLTFEVPRAAAAMLAELTSKHLGPVLSLRYLLPPLLHRLGSGSRAAASTSAAGAAAAPPPPPLLPAAPRGASKKKEAKKAVPATAEAVVLVCHACTVTVTGGGVGQQRAHTHAADAVKPSLDHCLRADGKGLLTRLERALGDEEQQRQRQQEQQRGSGGQGNSQTAGSAVASSGGVYVSLFEMVALLRGLLTRQPALLDADSVCEYYLAAQPQSPQSSSSKKKSHAKEGQLRKEQTRRRRSVGELLLLLLPTREALEARLKAEKQWLNLFSSAAATTATDDGGRIEAHESEATAMAARRPDLELLRDATSLLGEVCLHLACDKSCQAMIVGLVLPHVEKFFAMFAHLYGPYLLDAAAGAAGGAVAAGTGSAAAGGDAGAAACGVGVSEGAVLEAAASPAACLWGEVGAMLDVARALYLSIASMAGFDTLARHVPSAKRVRAFLGAGANLPADDGDEDADARREDASSTPETMQDAHHPSSSSSSSTSKSKDSSANKWDLFSSGREVDNAPPDALELMGKGLKWFKKKTDKHLLGKDPKRHHALDPPQPPSPTSLLLGMISNGHDGSSSNSSTVVVGGDDSDGEGGGGGGNIDDDEEEESAAWLIREAHTMNFSPPNQLDKTASSIRDGDDDEEESDDGGNPFLASDEEGCGEDKGDVVTGKDDSDEDAGGGAGRKTVYRQNSDEPPFHVDTTIVSGVEVGTANDEDAGGSGEDVDGDGDDEDKHSAAMELGSLPDFRQKVIRERIRRNSEGGPTGANAAGITTAAADHIPTQEKAGDSSLSSFPASRELQKARQQQQQQGRVVMGSSKPHRRFRRWEMAMCQAPLEARSSGNGGRVVPTPFALQLKVVATVDSSSGPGGGGGGEVGSGGVGGGSGGGAREAWRGVDNVVRTMVSGESMRGHTVSGSLHKAATNSSSISTGVSVDDDTAALLLASNHVGRGSLPSSSSSSPVLSAASSASGNSHGASARAIGGVGLFEGMDIGVFSGGGGEAEATPSPSPPPPSPSASKVDGGVGDVVSAGGDVLAFAAASASSVPSSGNSSSTSNDNHGNNPSHMPSRSGGDGGTGRGDGGAAVVGAGEATTDRGIRVMATDVQETVLLSAHRGGAVTVHSLRCLPELRKLSTYRAHGDGVVAAVLFPGARLAASCDLEGSLHVWDVETAKTLEVWRGGFSHSSAARIEEARRRSGGSGSEGSAFSSTGGGGGSGGARRGGADAAGSSSSSSSDGGCGSSSVGSSSSSSSSTGGAKQLRSAIFPKQHGATQGGSSMHLSHGLRTRGPYVALASMQADSVAGHHSSAAAAWNAWSRVGRRRRPKEGVQFGNLPSDRRNDDKDEDEDEYSREEEDDDDSDSNDGLWVGECPEASSSTQWQGSDHQLLAATPSMLHVFDLRASSHQQRREGSSSGGTLSAVVQRVQLVARCEWALSADSTLVDPDRDDAFKGPGLRCVGVGRSDGSGDPWLFAGGGTGRSWVVDRRTGKVLFDWQAHGVVSGGAGGFGDFMNAGSVGGDGGGGAGGMAGHSGGGACTGGMVGGGNVSSGGSGGMGSGGGGAFGGGGGGDIRNAVLSIVSGSARHTCVTTSYDQTCCVWDLSGSLPKRLSTLKGLPSVSTAGVMGAHLHSSTVHIHDFLASSEGDNHSAVGADSGPGSSGPPRTHSSSSLSPSSPRCRQVLFACAGHKVTVAPLPSLAQGLETARNQAMQHGGGAGVAAEAPVRYFNDRSGHKFHRHHLTTKASVVLPLWRMMLLGGSDDKIRVCV